MAVQTSGSDSVPMAWPNGARVALCLTFDFDAESLWLARDPDNAERLATLSQGRYGAKVGVPKILELQGGFHLYKLYLLWFPFHHRLLLLFY
jgi:hypothetical protein